MKVGPLRIFHRLVGAAIREQRTALGLSQAALADRLDRTLNFVGKIERGEQNLTLETLDRVLAALIAASRAAPRGPAQVSAARPSGVALLEMFAKAIGITISQVAVTLQPNQTPEETPGVTPEIQRLLRKLQTPMDRRSLQRALGLKAEKNFRMVHLRPAIDAGLITMTVRTKPNSRLQKYRLTPKGKAWLATARN